MLLSSEEEWMADFPSRTLHWEQEAGPGGVPALILFSWTSWPDWLDLWQQKSKQWLPQGRGCWPEEAWGNFLGGENVLWQDKTQVTPVYSPVSSDEAELVRSVHSAGVEPEARSSRQRELAWPGFRPQCTLASWLSRLLSGILGRSLQSTSWWPHVWAGAIITRYGCCEVQRLLAVALSPR